MRVIISLLLLSLSFYGNAQNDHLTKSRSLVDQINLIRTQRNLKPLKCNRLLSSQSYFYAKSLSKRFKYEPNLEHANSQWFIFNIYDGECLAYGVNPIEMWMNSPPHRNIILDLTMRKIGIGRYGKYYTLRVKR